MRSLWENEQSMVFLCALTDGLLVTSSPEHMCLRQVNRSTGWREHWASCWLLICFSYCTLKKLEEAQPHTVVPQVSKHILFSPTCFCFVRVGWSSKSTLEQRLYCTCVFWLFWSKAITVHDADHIQVYVMDSTESKKKKKHLTSYFKPFQFKRSLLNIAFV